MKDIYRRIKNSFFLAGFTASFVKLAGLLVDRIFDWKYGVETSRKAVLADLKIEQGDTSGGTMYQPSRVLPLRALFAAIQAELPENPFLLDLGSGKGRVQMLALNHGFKQARGVEFAKELCEISEKNFQIFLASHTDSALLEVSHGDVTAYPIQAKENVFFLYNPFSGETLDRVLDNLAQSLQNYPRKILIVYHRPIHKDVMEKHPAFQQYKSLEFWGYPFHMYCNTTGIPSKEDPNETNPLSSA